MVTVLNESRSLPEHDCSEYDFHEKAANRCCRRSLSDVESVHHPEPHEPGQIEIFRVPK
jgi:hypothetical protein